MELEDPSECYTFCGVRTKLFRNDRPHPDMFQSLCASLSHEAKGEVWTDGEEILCRTKAGADMLVAILSQMYSNRGISFDYSTGYYDPEEDERSGEVDNHTGWWYVTIAN